MSPPAMQKSEMHPSVALYHFLLSADAPLGVPCGRRVRTPRWASLQMTIRADTRRVIRLCPSKPQSGVFAPERDERHRDHRRVIIRPRDDIPGQEADAAVFLFAVGLTKHAVIGVAQF